MPGISLLNGNLKFDPRSFSAFPNEPKYHAQSLEEIGNTKAIPEPYKFDTVTLSDDAQPYRLTGDIVATYETYQDPNVTEIIQNSPKAASATLITSNYYSGYDNDVARLLGLGSFFFTASLDFLYDAAEQYAGIEDYQDFRWSVMDSSAFVRSLLDFIGSGSRGSDNEFVAPDLTASFDPNARSESSIMTDELKKLARELAERMKNGESTDLSSLTSTITIKGAQFTLSEVMDLQKSLQAFSELANNTEVKDQQTAAKLGLASTMADALIVKYSDTSEEFVSSLSSALNKLIDNYSSRVSKSVALNKPNYMYVENKASVGKTVYSMFSNLDYSSKVNLTNSYNKQMDELNTMLTEYTKYMQV